MALDTDIEAARPFHDAANPTHPALIDPSLSLVDMFGITNVPFGVMIDEAGTLVRPPEVAFAPPEWIGGPNKSEAAITKMPPKQQAVLSSMLVNLGDRTRYAAMVRDWVDKGTDSSYVLSAEEVVKRSRPRPVEFAEAAAEFEIGQHLHLAGHPLDAVPHFQRAHDLDPHNWSYMRQALSLVDPSMGDPYGTDLLTEVEAVGAEDFYPKLSI